MKAINHPTHGLILVEDQVPTDPDCTYTLHAAEPPEVPAGKQLRMRLTLDGSVVRMTWELLDVPLVAVSKYKIKSRVTAQEWAALKAAIASDADAQENWDITQEIDPAHPQTQQVISYLQAQGQLTTPLWQIFAQ